MIKIALLSRHLEDRKTAPVMCVERIVEDTHKHWKIGDAPKCMAYPHGFQCGRKAEFIVYPLGANSARTYCDFGFCFADALKTRLPRPAGEAEAIDAERIEKMQLHHAIAEAKAKHDADRLCEAHARTLSGYCERAPKFLVEAWSDHLERLCAHHTVRFRKHKLRVYEGLRYVGLRSRKIAPILQSVKGSDG